MITPVVRICYTILLFMLNNGVKNENNVRTVKLTNQCWSGCYYTELIPNYELRCHRLDLHI